MQKTALDHLDELLAGNRRFVEATPSKKRAHLALGQEPHAVVLGCSDSRVPVETIFDRGPGEIFVVRVAGNIARTDALASVEYAVEVLKTPLVLVLGHSGCGAVSAAIDCVRNPQALPGQIGPLVDALVPCAQATQSAGERWLSAAVAENARRNARALAEDSPILCAAARERRIAIRAAVYDIAGGSVSILE